MKIEDFRSNLRNFKRSFFNVFLASVTPFFIIFIVNQYVWLDICLFSKPLTVKSLDTKNNFTIAFSESCRTSSSPDCLKILASAATKFQVKPMNIKWQKPDLNQQVKHIKLTPCL